MGVKHFQDWTISLRIAFIPLKDFIFLILTKVIMKRQGKSRTWKTTTYPPPSNTV